MYNTFTQLYTGIERANIACKYIPGSKLYNSGMADQQKQMRRYYGEALALRAQYYYELIRNWGDVPASFIPAADWPTLFTTNSDRDSTYDHLLNDLKLAAGQKLLTGLLPKTKYTVQLLAGKKSIGQGIGWHLRFFYGCRQRHSAQVIPLMNCHIVITTVLSCRSRRVVLRLGSIA